MCPFTVSGAKETLNKYSLKEQTLPFTQHTPFFLFSSPELHCQLRCFFCLFCCPKSLFHLW